MKTKDFVLAVLCLSMVVVLCVAGHELYIVFFPPAPGSGATMVGYGESPVDLSEEYDTYYSPLGMRGLGGVMIRTAIMSICFLVLTFLNSRFSSRLLQNWGATFFFAFPCLLLYVFVFLPILPGWGMDVVTALTVWRDSLLVLVGVIFSQSVGKALLRPKRSATPVAGNEYPNTDAIGDLQ